MVQAILHRRKRTRWGPVSSGLIVPEWRRAYRDMVVGWPLWEGAGSAAADRSIARHGGDLQNGAFWTPTPLGWAIQCDGTGDRVRTDAVQDTTAITLAGVFNLDVAGSIDVLLSNSFDNVGFRMQTSSGGDLVMTRGGIGDKVSTLAVPTNTFVFLAVTDTEDGNNQTFFIRNLETGAITTDTTSGGTAANTASGGACIGEVNFSGFGMEGRCLVAYIWNRQWSNDDLARLAKDPFGIFRRVSRIPLYTIAAAAANVVILRRRYEGY